MSAPVSSFSKLSLSQEMQAPKGQRGPLRGKAKEPQPADDDPESGSEDESDEFWDRHVIALDHCRQYESRDTERRSYYAFQIACAEVKQYSIRITPTDSGSPKCSCDEEGTCNHVTWLLEQLGDSDAYQHITDVGLGNICEDLDWELREGANQQESRYELKKGYQASNMTRQTRGMIQERMKTVRDIMATLSPEPTNTYRGDIYDSSENITPNNVLVEGDLEATVARLLVMDDTFFQLFRSLVPRNLRATEHFRKMRTKAFEAIQLLDEYVQVGPKSGQHHDLAWCARTLVSIVDSISTNVTLRQPLSPSSREEAAKSLVAILFEIVKNHNVDIYHSVSWPRRIPHGEQSIDRNLYERLIKSTSRANPSGSTFVLKALQDLPEAQPFIEDLQKTLDTLSTIGWGPAPKAYRDKLAALITQLKSVPGPSASVGKRHASELDRKAKRMK